MNRVFWISIGVVLLGAPLASQSATPWCLTSTQSSPASWYGTCPIEGDCDVPTVRDGFLPSPSTPIRWYRVHLVVFRDDDGTNPAESPADIDAQMVTLNQDFLPARIQFTYTWEYVNDSTYRNLTMCPGPSPAACFNTMKVLYARDPNSQCNIFITDISGGAATFPWNPDAIGPTGGIVMGRSVFSGAHHVLTHEMGHVFGLWHLHHGVTEVEICGPCYERADGTDGDTTGDFAADTPPGPSDFGNCAPPGTADGCSGVPWGDTQRENHMSYGSSDGITCRNLFTAQQTARMLCWSDSVLGTWESVAATAAPYNGMGINLDTLSAGTIVIGSNWDADLTPQATRGAGVWIILLRSNDSPGLAFDLGLFLGLPMSGVSELLVDVPAHILNFSPAPHTGGGSTSMFSTPVPLDFGLVGNPWYAQAIVLGDLPVGAGVLDPWFSSAVGGTIGTF